MYALNEIVKIESYGIDYSESLIEVAKVAIPEGNFVVQEADKLCFSETSFDMIFSNGVFFYFPDQEYVKRVIINWTNQISTGGQFVLLDLQDKEYEKVYHQERKFIRIRLNMRLFIKTFDICFFIRIVSLNFWKRSV